MITSLSIRQGLRLGTFVMFAWLVTIPILGQQPCENFGAAGIAFPSITNTTYFNTLAVQPDGKIVAAGYYRDKKGMDMLVARFMADGKPDPTFGRFGIATFDITDTGKDDVAYCIAFTPDGHILIGGESNHYGAVIKISTNGNLYTGFSGDGILIYNYLYSTVDAIKITGTDFLAVGRTLYLNNQVFRKLSVYAFTAAGAPLTAYGSNGIYENFDFVVDRKRQFSASLQDDGKLVVANTMQFGGLVDNVTVTRVNTDGSTDNTFGTNGFVKYEATDEAWMRDVHVSGTSIYAGVSQGLNTSASPLAEVFKMNSNGSLATAFNGTGRSVHTVAAADTRLNGISVSAGGVVTFAGGKKNGTNFNYLLASYTAAGTPDAAFGAKTFSIPGYTSGILNDLAGLSDGSFLACGFAGSGSDTLGTLFKFTAGGALQTAFNGTGYQFAYHVPVSHARTVSVQEDGKIVVAGVTDIGGEFASTVTRLQSNGQPDLSFGKRGVMISDNVGTGSYTLDALHSLSSGGVIGAGENATDFLVEKFLPDGTHDNNFGTAGIVKQKVGADNEANDMIVDTQGNIVVGGSVKNVNQTYTEACVVRFLPNGTPDPAFGTSGSRQLPFSVRNDAIHSLAIAPDNKIYAAGNGMESLQRTGVVVRLNNDGSVDTSFGTNGTLTLSGSPALEIIARKVFVQADEKIIVVYYEAAYGTANDDKVFLCRYFANGELDTSYGTNGRYDLVLPGGKDFELRGFARDNTGRIYVSGNFVKVSTNYFYLARLLPNGGLDTSYGTSGHYETAAYRTEAGPMNTLAMNVATGSLYASMYVPAEDNMFAVACIGPAGTTPDCSTVPEPVITREDNELVSTVADSYRWLLNGSDLNVHTQKITPVNEGSYTVEATTGACTKTSQPFIFSVTGIEDHEHFIQVYPNPVKDKLFVQALRASGVMSVYSSQGSLVLQSLLSSTGEHMVSMGNLRPGFYILVWHAGNESQSFRIIKESH